MLNHNYIGTEHILLGLIHEGEGVAAKALKSLGVSLEAVRGQVEEIIGQGQQAPGGHIPFTPRAKKVLELSRREAKKRGDKKIGTEHILLGLIREGEGVAAQVLAKLGADPNRVRQQLTQMLTEAREDIDLVEPIGDVDDVIMGRQSQEFVEASDELLEEIRALLRGIIDRLERIERRLDEGAGGDSDSGSVA
jgi:ATP-dependent Clp protease ATP-binding subunit ClpA